MGNTFYFSHDYNARNNPDLARLRMKEGLAAVGAYWCIIEMLYEQNGRMRTQYDSIAFVLHDDGKWVREIVEGYGLFEFNEEYFWSNSVNRRLEEREEKSIKARDSANTRWGKDAVAKPPQCDSNAIKESKVKKSKVNKKRETHPHIVDCIEYFMKLKSTKEEAEKFFDHFTSNGWKVGGKATMRDWKASARNWVRRGGTKTDCSLCKGVGKYISGTGYEVRCDCSAGPKARLQNG